MYTMEISSFLFPFDSSRRKIEIRKDIYKTGSSTFNRVPSSSFQLLSCHRVFIFPPDIFYKGGTGRRSLYLATHPFSLSVLRQRAGNVFNLVLTIISGRLHWIQKLPCIQYTGIDTEYTECHYASFGLMHTLHIVRTYLLRFRQRHDTRYSVT